MMSLGLGIKPKIQKLCFGFKILLAKLCIHELNDKQFLFISMQGRSFSDNPKALSDYIESIDANAIIVWAFDSISYDKYKGLCKHCVKIGSVAYYKILLSSHYVITNQRLVYKEYPVKSKGQIYLQMWHGTALKRIEADIVGLCSIIEKYAKPDSAKIDLFTSNSNYMSNIYKHSFWYDGEVYETGTPRNDIFFKHKDEFYKDKIRKCLGIKGNSKILLYAPTFRGTTNSFEKYDIDIRKLVEAIKHKFGGDWTLVLRLHPRLVCKENEKVVAKKFPNAIDASMYPDIMELLVGADILMTDYSSTMFDFMYTGRPCILYTKDREEYDRGFYLSLEELPFINIKSNDLIEEAIKKFDEVTYLEKVKNFLFKIGSVEDGHASERIYKLLNNYGK